MGVKIDVIIGIRNGGGNVEGILKIGEGRASFCGGVVERGVLNGGVGNNGVGGAKKRV
ncbi:hypothetical protein [Staphylococcus cohnii]|uniref:hypothetical protein n=1 Tax=Staphylococcus cohnii TaxID=29382 RepID=UPI0016430CEA|nr:hypothetical protein [Staphylococcus cohnii]